MRVAGLDLSLTSTGIAMVESGEPAWTWTVKSTGKKDDNLFQRSLRLRGLAEEILDMVLDDDDELDLAVIENPSYGSKFGSPHDRSGLWWMVVGPLLYNEIPVATVSPQGRAKYGTGSGKSKKPEVYATVKDRYIPLGFEIPNNDVADAVILASMGSRHVGESVEEWGSLTLKQLEAMDGATWPA